MSAATCSTHTTITVPATGAKPDYSIRSLMMTCIRECVKTPERAKALQAECKELVLKHHPDSAADKKFGKHYAWYKATMKKAGEQV